MHRTCGQTFPISVDANQTSLSEPHWRFTVEMWFSSELHVLFLCICDSSSGKIDEIIYKRKFKIDSFIFQKFLHTGNSSGITEPVFYLGWRSGPVTNHVLVTMIMVVFINPSEAEQYYSFRLNFTFYYSTLKVLRLLTLYFYYIWRKKSC